MRGLASWCMAHRRCVIVGWLAVAVLASVLSHAIGPSYSTVFGIPGTESQRARELLKREFPAQSGDVDTIVFHVAQGTVDSPEVRAAILPLLGRVAALPHVAGIVSPYSTVGAVQVSANRMTAFATVNYDKQANLLSNNTGKPLLADVKALHVRGLQVAAGGQVVQQAEGFSVGSATGVGVIAALLILLLTFGSLAAAGLPLITAALGLVTGVALIGFATQVTSMSNISPDLALMIGLGVGIDYALFIVTRFRESYLAIGDVELSVLEAMDTSGRAIILAGSTVMIALLGMFATGVCVHVRPRDCCRDRRAPHAPCVADTAAGTARSLRPPARAPQRPSRGPLQTVTSRDVGQCSLSPEQRRRRALGMAALERHRPKASVAARGRLPCGHGRPCDTGPRVETR